MFENNNFLLVVLILFNTQLLGVSTQEIMCCSHTTGSCRAACEKISLVNIAADSSLHNETLIEVQKFCSAQLVPFWECLNTTLQEMSRGESWSGRLCCPLPHSETCRRSCVTATSFSDLVQGCRRSDEIPFFACLERQAYGDECCGNALTEECRDACRGIFRSRLTPTKHERNVVMEACEGHSPTVANCVRNVTKVTPATNLQKHMRCCDRSNKIKCREACKSVLSTTTTLQEIIDGLQFGGCGPPLFQDQFWQCFLKPIEPVSTSVEVSRIDRVGMDSAKWHCCQRATTNECRRLCSKTFTKEWSTLWDEFHLKCLTQVSQESLRNCIDEVDEPCELGCDGLSFCTNFNNRPTELFRSCTTQSDEAARNDVTLWQSQRELSLPGLTLPLKNITRCSPNIWQAVACTLQIKPCSRHSHANQICRDVCLEILTQCIDWVRLSPEHSPENICASLSPEDPHESCITLDTFLAPSETSYLRVDGQVSSPCKTDPCEPHNICTVNKDCPPGAANCPSYHCTPSCKLGEVSEYSVPVSTLVRIPIPNNPKGCLKICKCSRGKIEQCQPLPCLMLSSCWMGSNVQQDHGAVFEVECNKCSCYAGEVICSRRQCEENALTGRNTAFTTLPCNCPASYEPVCGRNGNVYPSACLAKCAGLGDGDFDYEACDDPCKNNPCPVGQKCIPEPKVCLSLMHKPCTQYQCVNGTINCHTIPPNPVCDVNNREHANYCHLAHSNEKYAYPGACRRNCDYRGGAVCGFNGRTYRSECAAHADYVHVDYAEGCRAVGLISQVKGRQCEGVQCKRLPHEDCLGYTPPGACCPICGGILKLLYSRKQIDRALYVLQPKSATQPLTLRPLLAALERQIQVAQCTLRGYLTVELDLFIAVVSTSSSGDSKEQQLHKYGGSSDGGGDKSERRYEGRPSAVQLEACVREAEKIATLVNRQSPRVASELILSSLMAAFVVHTTESGSVAVNSVGVLGVVCVVMLRFL